MGQLACGQRHPARGVFLPPDTDDMVAVDTLDPAQSKSVEICDGTATFF